MPITNDIRSYADNALEQGKQALGQAQTQLGDVTSKATGTVQGLRTQAEKAVNVDAVRAAVEPYLAQAKGYSTTVTDRAEDLYSTLKSDPRVAKLVGTAEVLTGVVVETVQERVVKPVQALTGRGAKAHVTSAPKAAATKPASTKPAGTTHTATKSAATKSAATKSAATKSAATKSAATKSAATKPSPTAKTSSRKPTIRRAPSTKAAHKS